MVQSTISIASAKTSKALFRAGASYVPALSILAAVFFMWGFTSVLNDVLVPHFKAAFQLTYTQSLLVQFCFYFGFLTLSLPAARLIAKVGYKHAIVLGLFGMALSCLIFIPAAMTFSYPMFLVALFLLAGAITLLQVAANPYVVMIGPEQTGSSRLNLVQAFNSLGTTLAPLFGGMLIFGRSVSGVDVGSKAESVAQRAQDVTTVELPYLIIAGVMVFMGALVWAYRLPELREEGTQAVTKAQGNAWHHRNLFWGVPAIFLYMICEIGIGSTLVNFISQPNIGNMSHINAAKYVSFFWGGAMVGRFIGSGLMHKVAPKTALALVATSGAILVTIAANGSGHLAMWALILTGLCHSVMFPTIFSMSIKGLGVHTPQGSGLLIMAISGGGAAIFQGVLADAVGLATSYMLPAACYLFLLFYAVWGGEPVMRKGYTAAKGNAP